MKTAKETNQKIIIEKIHSDPVSQQISKNKKLSFGAKAIYIYLNSHNENFYLSMDSIAYYLQVSKETIKRYIRELKKAGFLIVERIPNKNIYKYTCLMSPSNKDYLVQEKLENGQIIELASELNEIMNNPTITQETKDKVLTEIQKILKTNWINKTKD